VISVGNCINHGWPLCEIIVTGAVGTEEFIVSNHGTPKWQALGRGGLQEKERPVRLQAT
jgi:hypothetical protein